MKEKLQLSILTCAIALGGLQLSNAQYAGTAFNGSIPQVGTAVSASTVIEFEHYDALTSLPAGPGANNPSDVFPADPLSATGTYYETNFANSNTPDVRSESPVSFFTDTAALIGEGTDPIAITMVNGQANGEWLLFTVDVKTAGSYSLKMRYRAGSERIVTFSSVASDLSAVTNLVELTIPSSRRASDNAAVFIESEAVSNLQLSAGVQLIKVTFNGGVGADNFTLTLDSTLSVDNLATDEKLLKVFPNPSIDSKFNLNISTNWKVYSVLGVKVLEGFGNSIDLSSLAKGAYMLKANNVSKMLLSK